MNFDKSKKKTKFTYKKIFVFVLYYNYFYIIDFIEYFK